MKKNAIIKIAIIKIAIVVMETNFVILDVKMIIGNEEIDVIQ